jgi:hydrogenase nickel incorporation protein HypA/HybF
MHEEALLRDLRRKLEEVASAEGGAPIVRVRLWVGALAHVTPEGLRRRWPELIANTPARAAILTIDTSDDPMDPHAQGIRLEEVTVDDGATSAPRPRDDPGPTS